MKVTLSRVRALKMERILKPAKLEISPSDEACEKSWKHWRVTFENYVNQYVRQYNTKDAADNVVR